MPLSKRVIDKILESELYFDDDFDLEKKELHLSQASREWYEVNLGIRKLESTFVDYYSFASGGCGPNPQADCLYTLEQIVQDVKQSFHRKYPEIGKRYLQLSSIEGEHSYFYDTETDFLYGLDWSEMDEFFANDNKKEPLFYSFNDFIEWYYTDEPH